MKITELIQACHLVATRDLARLYQCVNGTKTINLAVNRNIDRFPEDFYFQLTLEEYNNLKFQFETSNSKHGGVRKLPYVFTEQGVAMLATILKSKVAMQVSIAIMDVFAKTKKYGHFIKICYNNQQINV